MATRKMQSPVSTITVPQVVPSSVSDLTDPDKFNPFMTQPLVLPPPTAGPDVGNPWDRNQDVSIRPDGPPIAQGVAIPQNPFAMSKYEPKATANLKQNMDNYNRNRREFRDYADVPNPEWTFNDAPPELGSQNQKRTSPVATDVALAMMGLGGLMGNSDYAIQAGTNFFSGANEGAHKADLQDYQSKTGVYDDRMKAAGVRYQRDSDRASQMMRSIDAGNSVAQRQNDSELDNITRQYQIDTGNDKAEEDRASNEKLKMMQTMAQFVNSGRLATANGEELNKFRDFLQGGQADPMMQYFYSGVSPDKKAQLDWAAADSTTRATIARNNREATLTGIREKIASADRIAGAKTVSDMFRQGMIDNNRIEVANIMAASKRTKSENPRLETALKMAQAKTAQAHSEISRAQNALSRSAQQLNTLRARKDFIDNNAPDGLTAAGKIAIEQAMQEHDRAEFMLKNAEDQYNSANQFYSQTYNAYAQSISQSGGVPLPNIGAPPPNGSEAFQKAVEDAVTKALSLNGKGGAGEAPSPTNGWKGLTADQYKKMNPAQKKTVPEDLIFQFMSGGK